MGLKQKRGSNHKNPRYRPGNPSGKSKMNTPKSFREHAIKNAINSLKSVRATSKQFKISESTLRRWLKQHREKGQLSKQNPPGRPRKLLGRENTYIGKIVSSNKIISSNSIASKIQQKYHNDVSSRTIKRTLNRLSYTKKKAIKKPLLTDKHKVARKNWCIDNKSRSWKNVVFSDE